MAIRVTAMEVKSIIDTNAPTETIDAMIIAANAMTDRVAAITVPFTLTATELKEIERWLAAHFVAVYDPRESRVEIGEAEMWVEGQLAYSEGLGKTRYGQMAKLLDRNGTLSTIGMKRAKYSVAERDDGIPNNS